MNFDYIKTMKKKELNTAKLEFIKEFLDERDENLVQEQIAFYRSLKQKETLPNISRSEEELRTSVKKAEKDYHNGIYFSMEEVFEKYKR